MRHLFEKEALEEILSRIEKLTPASQPLWGKMNVAQMLAHCNATMEVATSRKVYKRSFLGFIFGKIAKKAFLNEKPLSHNSPTAKEFLIVDQKDFEAEKGNLINMVTEFSIGGEDKAPKHPHSFFGKFTPAEWSRQVYKHLDHHLQQFGV